MSNIVQEIELETGRGIERLHEHPRARRVLEGTASAEDLATYYASAHAAVRHAAELLRASGEQLEREHAPELAQLMLQKSREEFGHELWLQEDARAIGLSIGDAGSPVATPAAHLYVGFHRSVIPLSGYGFLGTALVLESFSTRCAGAAADNLRTKSGIAGLAPDSIAGVTFFHHHAAEDIAHVAELSALIDRYVRDPGAQAYVLLCARFTATIYADFF